MRLKHTYDFLRINDAVNLAKIFTSWTQPSGTAFQITRSLRTAALDGSWLKWRNICSLLKSYKQLSKAKLSAFVVASTGASYYLASKDSIDGYQLGCTLLGTFGASACANTFNQIIEWKHDAMMNRTKLRPLPSKQLSRSHALAFALFSGLAGLTLLAHNTNEVATGLAAGNILLYAGVYTPLKQVTYLNTWVGAVVGAIPPLIGWSAATGSSLDPGAWSLASLLYFWQLPHFLSLAWTYRVDYANAGFQMVSKFDLTGKKTSACAFRNCLYLLPVGFLAAHLEMTDRWFVYESSLLTLLLALSAATFRQKPSKLHSRALFRASILYLPVVLSAMILHRKSSTSPHYTWNRLKEELKSRVELYYERQENKHTEELDSFQLEDEYQLLKKKKKKRDSSDGYRPPFAPFPFVPVPTPASHAHGLWDDLDDVIREVSMKS